MVQQAGRKPLEFVDGKSDHQLGFLKCLVAGFQGISAGSLGEKMILQVLGAESRYYHPVTRTNSTKQLKPNSDNTPQPHKKNKSIKKPLYQAITIQSHEQNQQNNLNRTSDNNP